jgi:tetratricopeptide (TPR) repeat protein
MRILNPRQVFQELRRRRVFNTAALYIVGAWVALQVAELAFPAVLVPEEAIRWVWLGAFLLFPLVLVFGWRYDITRTGIQRTAPSVDQEAATDLKKSDHWFIGGLATITLIVVGAMLVEIGQMETDESTRILPAENSIAVIPFGVCEDRTSDLPLASGLTGEVIERLAARDRLKVIGRATSYNLAGAGVSTRQASDLLGTQYILSGTLCRDGLDLTLEAELTDREGFIEWRERFTQQVNRFDQVEDQLATLVANGVALELGDVIQGLPDDPVNRLALEQLLIGQAHQGRGDLEKAQEAYTQALEHQPELAQAVWGLALLEMNRGDKQTVGSSIENAWPLGEQALELAMHELERGVPDFKANWVAGQILHTLARWHNELTWRKANELGEEQVKARKEEAREQFVEAEQYLRSALLMNPSDTEVRSWLSTNLYRQGPHRNDEAFEILQEGLALDPFNQRNSVRVANELANHGQYRQAMEVLDRFEALPLDARPDYGFQLEIMNNYHKYDEKLAKLIEIIQAYPEIAGTDGWVIIHMWWMAGQIAGLGLPEEAEDYYQAVNQMPYSENRARTREFFLEEIYLSYTGGHDEIIERLLPDIAGMSNEEILDNWNVDAMQYARVLWGAGEKERAIELFEALRHMAPSPFWAERDTWSIVDLGVKYLEEGRVADARPLFDEAIGILEGQVDSGMRHPDVLYQLAYLYALVGDEQSAYEMLELAVDYGSYSLVYAQTPEDLDDELVDPFPHKPRFDQLRSRMQSLMDQQAADVRNLLAHHDLDALLVPVFEYADAEIKQAE